METPIVYVICDKNCKFEGMTKEQIYTAILQAVNEGTIGNIDAGFVTTIKTINGLPLKFFVGEQAAYDKLTAEDKENLFAIITNDTTKEGIIQAITDLQRELKGLKKSLLSGEFVVGKANKIETIVITSYDDLMSYIPLIPNANYNSYAVAINDHPITFPDGTVLPAWGTGMLVVEADASLTLTYPDGSIISAFCVNTDPCTWSVKKLSGVSIVGSDNKVTARGLYAVTLRCSGEYYTHMLNIVDLDARANSAPDTNGHYAIYSPTSGVIVSSSEVETFVEKAFCIAEYDF